MTIETRLKALEQIRDKRPSDVSMMSDDQLMNHLGLPDWKNMDHSELMQLLKDMAGEQG